MHKEDGVKYYSPNLQWQPVNWVMTNFTTRFAMQLLEFCYSHFVIYGTRNDTWCPRINIHIIWIRPNISSHLIHLPLPCLYVFRVKGTTVRNYLEVNGGDSHIEVPENTNPSPTCTNKIGLANRFSNNFYSWHRRDYLGSLLWKAIIHHFLHQPSKRHIFHNFYLKTWFSYISL